MVLTQKETELLKDLKSQEQLCIEKYTKYQSDACDPALKNLFGSILSAEQTHLQTINDILAGKTVSTGSAPSCAAQATTPSPSSCDAESKKSDGYLCRDALAMEKHVSSVYDTSVFEFSSPALRDALAHIQKEEQNHGQQLYSYLSTNGMYS